MTRDPANRVPVKPPAGYEREDFVGVLPLLADGRIKTVFGYRSRRRFIKAQIPPLPNGKVRHQRHVSSGPVRLSLPGENDDWPDGGAGLAARS